MTPTVHPTAQAFDAVASIYELGRPEYPPEALQWLVDHLPLRAGDSVVDLAAGTGKLTRGLLRSGAQLTGVEPLAGMRREFSERVPGVPVLEGTAEAIPLPAGSVDAVVIGQAFHWFATPAAVAEMVRVLRPGGALGVVFNRRDESVPWVRKLGEILEPHDPGIPRTRDSTWRQVLDSSGRFAPLEGAVFRMVQVGDESAMVARAVSVSYVARLPVAERERVADAVRDLLRREARSADADRIELPYRTEAFATRRVD